MGGAEKTGEELDVFRLAHQLAIRIYTVTRSFPREEIYGITVQMRRAATSVPANLAEGAHRISAAEYRTFVSFAKGSAGEIRYHVLLAGDLGYISAAEAQSLRYEYARVLQMLTKLVRTLGIGQTARIRKGRALGSRGTEASDGS